MSAKKPNHEKKIEASERKRQIEEQVKKEILEELKFERNVEATEEPKIEMSEAERDKARLKYWTNCFDEIDAQAAKMEADNFYSNKTRKNSRFERKSMTPNMDELVKKIKKIDTVGHTPDWLQK